MSIKRSPNFKDIKMFNKEKKQVVFVTGCTGGIGAGICEEIKRKITLLLACLEKSQVKRK